MHKCIYAYMHVILENTHTLTHPHTHTHLPIGTRAQSGPCRILQDSESTTYSSWERRRVSMYVMFVTCVSRPEWNQTTHICLQSCCVHVHRQTDRQTTDRPSRDAPVEFGARKSGLDRHVRRACFPRVPPPTWQNTSGCQTYPWCMNSMTTTNSCELCALGENV